MREGGSRRILFAGIPLPSSYDAVLAELRAQWEPRLKSAMRWVRPGQAHVTLRFFGPIPPARTVAILDALRGVSLPRFRLQCAGSGCFPSVDAPRVVCQTLKARLDTALAGVGFPRNQGRSPRT